jgi:valyl-tRNA synthetase
LTTELNKGFLKSVESKLANENFVAGAPEKIGKRKQKKTS